MSETRRALIILAATLAGVVLVVGGGSWWALTSTLRAFEPTRWSEDGVPLSEARRVFGVRFAEPPARWQARQMGTQDAAFEALALLGDAAAVQRFLEANALTATPDEDLAFDGQEEVLGQPVRARRRLSGAALESERFDRVAGLLEVDGATWLALEAFER